MKTLAAVGAAVFALLGTGGITSAQSFTCPIGKDPACLGYGAKVCTSFAKCVDQSAVCFDSYTCDYKGFVCKSKLDDAIDEIEDKVRRYNHLVSEYNELQSNAQAVASELASLASDSDDYVRCVRYSDSIEAAQSCPPP